MSCRVTLEIAGMMSAENFIDDAAQAIYGTGMSHDTWCFKDVLDRESQ